MSVKSETALKTVELDPEDKFKVNPETVQLDPEEIVAVEPVKTVLVDAGATVDVDPGETIGSLLSVLGAQKYIDIFQKQNIDKQALSELSEEDLIKLGVDDSEIRKELMSQAKKINPASDESVANVSNLGPVEIVDIFEECALLLHRIHLSMVASNAALSKSKKVSDCLLYKDKYASNLALATLDEINNLLNSMENAVHTQLKTTKSNTNSKKKKLIVGTIGSAVIAMLAVLFTRSLRQLR